MNETFKTLEIKMGLTKMAITNRIKKWDKENPDNKISEVYEVVRGINRRLFNEKDVENLMSMKSGRW